jgi:hypothetical protein
MPDHHRKEYLGDGVYAAHDDFQIVLTTENGVSVQNTVYLDPSVFAALVRYEASLRDWIKERQK